MGHKKKISITPKAKQDAHMNIGATAASVRSSSSGQSLTEITPEASTALALFDLMSITDVPRDWEQRKTVSAIVTGRLLDIFSGRISSADLELFKSDSGNPECDRLWAAFDEIVIEQAATLGWRVYLGEHVLRRVQMWHDKEEKGPELLMRLSDAIVRSARAIRGEVRNPINSPELYWIRKAGLEEVRLLSKKLHAQLVVRQKLPALSELYAMMREEIVRLPNVYGCLYQNMRSFFRYLEIQDAEQGGYPLTKRLAMKQATPSELVNGWTDWGFTTPEGQSRKIISKLGNRKR